MKFKIGDTCSLINDDAVPYTLSHSRTYVIQDIEYNSAGEQFLRFTHDMPHSWSSRLFKRVCSNKGVLCKLFLRSSDI